jgi:hypothetical protein
LHKPLRVQFLPESREDILYPGGDRQQPVHARMAGGAQGDHQMWILDTGLVADNSPNPSLAAGLADTPTPLDDEGDQPRGRLPDVQAVAPSVPEAPAGTV